MKQHRLLLKAQAQREEKPSGCLRQLQSCEDALSVKHGGHVAPAVKWVPTAGSVVEVDASAGESYHAPAPTLPTRNPHPQVHPHSRAHTAHAQAQLCPRPRLHSCRACPLTQPPVHAAAPARRASAGRVVIGVHFDHVPAMLAWLAPRLARDCAHMLTRATSGQARGPRGASIILNGAAESSSGPHKDSEPTLLLALSGSRMVWYASPDSVSYRVQLRAARAQDRLGAPTFLPSEYDPTCNEPRAGVRWCEPICLEAGSAIWIPAGWWHCVLAEPHAVAVPCEIVPGAFSGQEPRVLPKVALSKPHGSWAGRHISRRVGWASAESVSRMFAAVSEDVHPP